MSREAEQLRHSLLQLHDELNNRNATTRQTLIDLIKNRILCGCCDSDETCARFITTFMQRVPFELWPSLSDVSPDGTADTMHALIETTDASYTRTSQLYLPILLALRDRRFSS